MPKATKDPENKIEISTIQPKKKHGVPVAIRQHQIVTNYAEEIPVDEIDGTESDNGLLESDPAPSADDPTERFITEMRSSPSKWDMCVYRLPNYDYDGRTDTRAHRERVGKLTFNPDTYEDDITRLYARPGKVNTFLPLILKDNSIYSQLPVVRTEPQTPEENPAAYTQQPAMMNGAIAPPVDPFLQLEKTLEFLARVRRVIPEPEPQAQPQVNTTEQALLQIMNADGEVVESITDRLKGLMRRKDDGAREIGWMDLIMEAIKADVLPKMIREAKALILEVRNDQAQETYTPQPAPTGQQLNRDNPGGARSTGVEMPQVVEHPEIQLLNFAVGACSNNWPIEAASNWIIQFEEQNPSVTPYISLFIGMPPDTALQWVTQSVPNTAQVASLPHATDWVEKLQGALKPIEEIKEENK